MKLLVLASNLNIEKYLDYVDGFIFGYDGFSVNNPYNINLDNLKKINKLCKENNKELFISLNKNIYSREIDKLKKELKEIDKLNLNGILYADTCFINLKDNINTPLFWSQEHLTTNYNTINLWCEYGSSGANISNDITLREIKEIRKNIKCTLFLQLFGYVPIFTSKRHEIKNYTDTFNIKDNSKINYMEKEDKMYPIVDDIEGTTTYSSYILDSYDELKELNDIDYGILNSFDIEENTFLEILKIYSGKSTKKINDLLKVDKGFLYQETIYKVK